MKTKIITIKKIIVLTIVASISFALGLYTDHKVNKANEQSTNISNEVIDLESLVPSNAPTTDIKKEDPLIHLKMLQKDVETFKALMEEVKNELFVTKT